MSFTENCPPKTLEKIFGSSTQEAIDLIENNSNLRNYASVDALILAKASNQATLKYEEQLMTALNEIGKGYGVKSISADQFTKHASYLYLDKGDPYIDTAIFDCEEQCLFISNVGAVLEKMEKMGKMEKMETTMNLGTTDREGDFYQGESFLEDAIQNFCISLHYRFDSDESKVILARLSQIQKAISYGDIYCIEGIQDDLNNAAQASLKQR